ncbi:MAG: hypothetical protein ACOYT4_01405 [Nanoarchaeota archaeon]
MKIKILTFSNKSRTNEFFGLSNSGKTTYLKDLQKKGFKYNSIKDNSFEKIIPFLKFFFENLSLSLYLFYTMNTNWITLERLNFKKYIKIFLMRNSYLSAVFARCYLLRDNNQEIFVDEFFLQSIFMIYQKKANEKELSSIIKKLPKSSKVFLVEESKKIRYKRMNSKSFPGENIDRKYAIKWMENSEHNYNLSKKILLKNEL